MGRLLGWGDSSGGASAVFTILVKAAGRTVTPKPARLNSHNCPSASRKAVLCLSFSAIGNWWKAETRSIWVKYRLPLRLENMLCISPKPPLSITRKELSRRQLTHSLMVPSFFLTQRTCAAHGDLEGRIRPRSFNL